MREKFGEGPSRQENEKIFVLRIKFVDHSN